MLSRPLDHCESNEELAKEPSAGFETIAAFLAARERNGPCAVFWEHEIEFEFRTGWLASAERDETPWDTWNDQMRREFGEEAGEMMVRGGYWRRV